MEGRDYCACEHAPWPAGQFVAIVKRHRAWKRGEQTEEEGRRKKSDFLHVFPGIPTFLLVWHDGAEFGQRRRRRNRRRYHQKRRAAVSSDFEVTWSGPNRSAAPIRGSDFAHNLSN